MKIIKQFIILSLGLGLIHGLNFFISMHPIGKEMMQLQWIPQLPWFSSFTGMVTGMVITYALLLGMLSFVKGAKQLEVENV